MNDLLIVSAPPHIHSNLNLRRAIYTLILSLIIILIASTILFGIYSFLVVSVSTLSAVIFEATFTYVTRKKITIQDGTAILTGLLIGLSLPPMVPLWIPIFGSFFAIVFVKQFFGGLGFNFVNPALTARAFLMLSFPWIMTTSWKSPVQGSLSGIDTITRATPLTLLKNPAYYGNPDLIIANLNKIGYLKILLLGQIGGSIGETFKVLIIACGIILLISKIIDYRIVAGYILSFCLLNLILPGVISPIFQLLSGGVLLAIFFMATDWVTTPVTKIGRWIFGIGCGLFTALFRSFLSFPEGVTPAILLMNFVVPLIDRLTIKRRRSLCQRE